MINQLIERRWYIYLNENESEAGNGNCRSGLCPSTNHAVSILNDGGKISRSSLKWKGGRRNKSLQKQGITRQGRPSCRRYIETPSRKRTFWREQQQVGTVRDYETDELFLMDEPFSALDAISKWATSRTHEGITGSLRWRRFRHTGYGWSVEVGWPYCGF